MIRREIQTMMTCSRLTGHSHNSMTVRRKLALLIAHIHSVDIKVHYDESFIRRLIYCEHSSTLFYFWYCLQNVIVVVAAFWKKIHADFTGGLDGESMRLVNQNINQCIFDIEFLLLFFFSSKWGADWAAFPGEGTWSKSDDNKENSEQGTNDNQNNSSDEEGNDDDDDWAQFRTGWL